MLHLISSKAWTFLHTSAFSAFIIPDVFVSDGDGVLETESNEAKIFSHHLSTAPQFPEKPMRNHVEKETKALDS